MAVNKSIDQFILETIQKNTIYEQVELQEILAKRGFIVPQATISRKLRKLGVAKIAGVYKFADFSQMNIPIVTNLQVSDFGMVVLHTLPGNANALAYYLDKKYTNLFLEDNKKSGIIGSIAGDDTVLLIIKNKIEISKVLEKLYKEFPYLKQ